MPHILHCSAWSSQGRAMQFYFDRLASLKLSALLCTACKHSPAGYGLGTGAEVRYDAEHSKLCAALVCETLHPWLRLDDCAPRTTRRKLANDLARPWHAPARRSATSTGHRSHVSRTSACGAWPPSRTASPGLAA